MMKNSFWMLPYKMMTRITFFEVNTHLATYLSSQYVENLKEHRGFAIITITDDIKKYSNL